MPGLMASQSQREEAGPSVHLVLDNLKSLTAILQAIKASGKQPVSVAVAQDGLTFRWEDEAKTLQSSVFLRTQLFSTYECPSASETFGVNFSQLVDTLNVFASGSDEQLHLRYPGPNGELQLEMADAAAKLTTYARLYCLEQAPPRDMLDYWQDPGSYFMAPGHLLKEAVEDLEWPAGAARLDLQRDPQHIMLSASGTGALEIDLPGEALSGFHCASERLAFGYKYRNLRAALSHIPASKDVSTKVSMDVNGMLKVMHIVPLAAGASHHQQQHAVQPSGMPSASLMATQGPGGGDASRGAIVQFVTVPLDEDV